MSKGSIPRTKRKVKRVAKSKTRKKSPAKQAKRATKKRAKVAKARPKKAKRVRVSAPKTKAKSKAVKRTPKKVIKRAVKKPSMNIHTRKPATKPVKKRAKKTVKKQPRKTRRERDLELALSAMKKMIPAALIQNIIRESAPPKFAPMSERISADELESVTKILNEDLEPEPDSERLFIPLQPSIRDNMAPGTQRAIQLVEQYGIRFRNMDPEQLAFWAERNRSVRMIMDVTGIWNEGGNERQYMESAAEQQGRNARAVYHDILSPGDLETVFAESSDE